MSEIAPTPGAGPSEPTPEGAVAHEVAHAVASLRQHLESLERVIDGAGRAPLDAARRVPGWMRPAAGEERWPVALAIAVAILLQVALPDRLVIGPNWVLPALEGALGIGLTIANPRRIDRRSRALRGLSIGLIALTSLANGWSSYELIKDLINGTAGKTAGPLLSAGASIYLTNIIVFALWYWEWDRGGPVERAAGTRPYPDLLFPQMTQDRLAPEDWRPKFFDYFYVSYTNATAFSPTDTMPLAEWTKLLFTTQSAISLVTVALVVARAVNILS